MCRTSVKKLCYKVLSKDHTCPHLEVLNVWCACLLARCWDLIMFNHIGHLVQKARSDTKHGHIIGQDKQDMENAFTTEKVNYSLVTQHLNKTFSWNMEVSVTKENRKYLQVKQIMDQTFTWDLDKTVTQGNGKYPQVKQVMNKTVKQEFDKTVLQGNKSHTSHGQDYHTSHGQDSHTRKQKISTSQWSHSRLGQDSNTRKQTHKSWKRLHMRHGHDSHTRRQKISTIHTSTRQSLKETENICTSWTRLSQETWTRHWQSQKETENI